MNIIDKLFELGAVKFGSFTLKSGIVSPIYIDLRLTISSPKLLVSIAEAIFNLMRPFSFDLICGVPYSALPFATAISITHDIPMVLLRKEKKEYGTAKLIEGIFSSGQTCLLIEDVVTSGQSILNAATHLWEAGLEIRDVVVLVDREQGGRQKLEAKGYRFHSVCTISTILEHLLKQGKINIETAESVRAFIRNHQT